MKKKINPIMDFVGDDIYYGVYVEDEMCGVVFHSLSSSVVLTEQSMKDIKNVIYEKKPPTHNIMLNSPSETMIFSVVSGENVNKKTHIEKQQSNIHSNYYNYYTYYTHIHKHNSYTPLEDNLAVYIEFEDSTLYTLFSLWILGTYFYYAFNSYPYIFVHGLKGSGKSKVLDICSHLSFNGLNAGSISASACFRVIDLYRCSLFIDEAEHLTSSKTAPELRNILLNGYKKGTYFMRSIQKSVKSGDFEPEIYNIYSPKMIANISGIDDVLDSRTIYVNIKRALTKKGETEIDPKRNEIIYARDYCYQFAFKNWKEIKNIYVNLVNETSLRNRDFEIWKPILSLAKFFGDKTYEEIKNLAEQKTKEKKEEDYTEVIEVIIIQKLKEYCYNKEDHFLPIKEIMGMVNSSNEFEWLNLIILGKLMRRMGFKHKRRVASGIEYRIEKKFIANLYRRYVDEGIKEEVVEDVD